MISVKEYVALHKAEIKKELENLNEKIHFVIVSMNDDEASKAYIKGKLKDSEEVGIFAEVVRLPLDASQKDMDDLIEKLNNDPSVHGLIVQMPLPKQIDEERVKRLVSPKKDVDGFNPLSKVAPCTPKGIINFLKHLEFNFVGKNAVVIGRSNIVGRPMAQLLLNESCNVTVLHSKTSKEDFNNYVANADLIVVATGRKYLLNKSHKLKESAYVIDVGINRVDGKLYGDCEPELPVAYQTPVPGGVGLLTRVTLLDNLLDIYKDR